MARNPSQDGTARPGPHKNLNCGDELHNILAYLQSSVCPFYHHRDAFHGQNRFQLPREPASKSQAQASRSIELGERLSLATAFCDATRSRACVLLLGLVSKPNPLAGNAAPLSIPAQDIIAKQRAREMPGTYNFCWRITDAAFWEKSAQVPDF